MQAVVSEQNGVRLFRRPAIAREFRRIGEFHIAGARFDQQRAVRNRIGDSVRMRSLRQRRGKIEQRSRAGDHLRAADGIVPAAALRAAVFGDGVGAVERVVKRTPAGVGGVEGVTGVARRHHKLRAGDGAQFLVDIGGRYLERRRLGDEIADLFQERDVLNDVEISLVLAMPEVELFLQGVALVEQGAVAGSEIGDDLGEAGPERLNRYAGSGQRLSFDKRGKLRIDNKAGEIGHRITILGLQQNRGLIAVS